MSRRVKSARAANTFESCSSTNTLSSTEPTLQEGGLGLDDAAAARATWVLIVYVLGSVALDVADTDGRAPLPSEEERTRIRLAGFRAGDASAFPHTAATAPAMAAWVSTEQFRWGLDRILDGLLPKT